VEQKLAALRQQIEEERQQEKPSQTVGQYIVAWYELYYDEKRAPATCKLTREQIDHHIVPGLGDIQLNQLQPDHIQEWVNRLQRTRCRITYEPKSADGQPDKQLITLLAEAQPFLSSRRIEMIVGVLHMALKRAVVDKRIMHNPMVHVNLPPVPAYEPRVLLDEEVEQILRALRGYRLETLYHVLICLGLRRGEALKLKWKDLNLESGKASLFIRKGKTPASRRTLPLSDELVDSLLQHREHQQREQEHFGVQWNPKRLVFPSLAGTPLSGRNVYRHFKSVLIKAGVEEKKPPLGNRKQATTDLDDDEPSVRIHDLRHWACSYMLREGTPLKEVQEVMGHATVTTTLRIYAHVIGDGKRQAINRTSRLLKGSKDE
jgi:integrase